MTYIYQGLDWTEEKLYRIYDECRKIGEEELKLDIYENQFHIVDYQKMLEIYSSVGMPIMYNHWSFGKSYLQNYNLYKKGYMGLALEMVINTDPCINYLLDENSITGQALVIAHAAIGHNSFFKNNYLFKEKTQADSILDYLEFAKKYIRQCEEKYGEEEVELLLDCAHSLQNHSIDKYKKPRKLSAKEEKERQKERLAEQERTVNELWNLLPSQKVFSHIRPKDEFLPHGPEENLLYFLEKKSPVLTSWQREILRIVRKLAGYFSPQAQTKVQNEGWASTVHYYIMNRLYEKQLIDNAAMLEFLNLHTSVVRQEPYDVKHFSGFNPYHLGFNIFADIKRICQNPTEEDKYWSPDIAGTDWVETWNYVYQNFRDESFIRQFLSPKLIRDMKLFEYDDFSDEDFYTISKVHNERGYRDIRKTLADSKAVGSYYPDIQVDGVDFENRECFLVHYSETGELLEEKQAYETLLNFEYLWGFDCHLTTKDRSSGYMLADYSQKD